MIYQVTDFWNCQCNVCEPLHELMKQDKTEPGALSEIWGNAGKTHDDRILLPCGLSLETIWENRREIQLMVGRQKALDAAITEEIRRHAQQKLRMPPPKVFAFQHYCILKNDLISNLTILLLLLQYDLQLLLNSIADSFPSYKTGEYGAKAVSYYHEQEFVKAYLYYAEDFAVRAWAAISA